MIRAILKLVDKALSDPNVTEFLRSEIHEVVKEIVRNITFSEFITLFAKHVKVVKLDKTTEVSETVKQGIAYMAMKYLQKTFTIVIDYHGFEAHKKIVCSERRDYIEIDDLTASRTVDAWAKLISDDLSGVKVFRSARELKEYLSTHKPIVRSCEDVVNELLS